MFINYQEMACGAKLNPIESIRESQKRQQIGLGRQEIRRATRFGALRTFEPDAV
jgi:hypothetical protein